MVRSKSQKGQTGEEVEDVYEDKEYDQVEDDHIKIALNEDSEFMEFPKEDDNTVLLSTIQAQFPEAIGMKYKGSSGAWRALKAVDNVLEAPKDGWGDQVYYLTTSDTKKRKLGDSEENGLKGRKVVRTSPFAADMAVIGLPYKTTLEEMREYFETNYGKLTYSEIKHDRETGKSRGFGFIRFESEDTAREVSKVDHYFDGRRVEVREKKVKPMKMFIGRVPAGTTVDELREYFTSYGDLTDVYIPTPFRNFAFITFASDEDAKLCMREKQHSFKGARLNVMERNQNQQQPQNGQIGQNGRQSSTRDNGSFSGGYSTQRPNMNQKANSSADANMDQVLKAMLLQMLTKN